MDTLLEEVSLERREKEKTELFNDINEINKFEINFTDFKEGEVANHTKEIQTHGFMITVITTINMVFTQYFHTSRNNV